MICINHKVPVSVIPQTVPSFISLCAQVFSWVHSVHKFVTCIFPLKCFRSIQNRWKKNSLRILISCVLETRHRHKTSEDKYLQIFSKFSNLEILKYFQLISLWRFCRVWFRVDRVSLFKRYRFLHVSERSLLRISAGK